MLSTSLSWGIVFFILQIIIGIGTIFLPASYIAWIPYILNLFFLYKVVVTVQQWGIWIIHIFIIFLSIFAKLYIQTTWEPSLKVFQNNGIGNAALMIDSSNEIYSNYCPTTIPERLTTGNGTLLWYLDNGEYVNLLSVTFDRINKIRVTFNAIIINSYFLSSLCYSFVLHARVALNSCLFAEIRMSLLRLAVIGLPGVGKRFFNQQ